MSEKPNLTNCIDLHPDNKTWRNFLKNQCIFNFNLGGYDVYNATNCWYLVDSQGNITLNIYGYHILTALHHLTGIEVKIIREKLGWPEIGLSNCT